MTPSVNIFLFASLVDDLIDGRHTLGGEAGFATAAIQILNEMLGAVPYALAGRIGTDASGDFLVRTLQGLRVDTISLVRDDVPTCQAIIEGVEHARFAGFRGGPICRFTAEERKHHAALLAQPGWLFCTSNTLYDEETFRNLTKILVQSPRLVLFDLNWREACPRRSGIVAESFIHERLLPACERATVLKGTTDELRRFAEWRGIDRAAWFEQWPRLAWICETRGPNGALVTTRSTTVEEPGQPVTVMQDTGAGDTFSGAVLYGLARLGMTTTDELSRLSASAIRDILALACRVAALTVQGFGVSSLDRHRDQLKIRQTISA